MNQGEHLEQYPMAFLSCTMYVVDNTRSISADSKCRLLFAPSQGAVVPCICYGLCGMRSKGYCSWICLRSDSYEPRGASQAISIGLFAMYDARC